EAYNTYYGLTTGKVTLKPKYVHRSTKTKTEQAPKVSLEIALTETEEMKIVTKRSKIDFHSSHASGSSTDEGTGVSLGVLDVPTYGSKDEQISWKSSDDEVSLSKDDDDDAENDDGQDDDNEQTKLDNDDLRVHIPSHYESTDDEAYDDVTQGDNVEEEKLDEEENVNELYRDSSSLSSGFISNMLNPNLDTGIDSILTLNTESTSLVDVPVTTNVEMPLIYVKSYIIFLSKLTQN
nr:hypothetical protein [Tanacetum cinerariifolium]